MVVAEAVAEEATADAALPMADAEEVVATVLLEAAVTEVDIALGHPDTVPTRRSPMYRYLQTLCNGHWSVWASGQIGWGVIVF